MRMVSGGVATVWCAVLVGLTWADTLEVPTISPHCRARGAVAGTKQRRWRGGART